MASIKPIRIWITPPGPNSWKVIMVLEELSVPYEIKAIEFADIKRKPFIDINPNGRVPAIGGPNTDITLWESGAIIQYIVEQYDVNKTLTYDTLKEKHLLNQYLQFQMSGQGPYFGVAAWFNILHQEKVPSAIERYNAQLKRVLGVLNTCLEGKQWLVGDKMTYADLSFMPWNHRVDSVILCAPEDKFVGYPNVQAWHERMVERPAWKKCMEIRDSLMQEQGLENGTGRPARFKTFQEYEEAIARGEDVHA
ncbi:glutathione S-transferase [Hypoxylon trugodes]|uniref:glutathione S-transferase n=1 Tax=Hypoxylon trugodes TaxID=326681 RepID=UPI00219ED851|nr:glutathione S-transferase [Hypoxylon trugodes]KAI1384040.1 glutathione S-transferase [Hypoxylon trugodes]